MKNARIRPSKPSSTTCAVELSPAANVRSVVLASGWLLLLMGVVLIQHLPVSATARWVLAVFWLADAGSCLVRLARAQAGVSRVILSADGRHRVRGKDGRVRPLRPLRDSVLTQHLAWLRFVRDDGGVYSELFWRRQVESQAWRRMQVIWRWAAGGTLAK